MAANLSIANTTGDNVAFTCDSAVFLAGDVDRVIKAGSGRAVIIAVANTTVVRADIIDAFANTGPIGESAWTLNGQGSATMDPDAKKKGASVKIVASLATFRTNDAGKWMTMYGGLIRLDRIANNTVAHGEIILALSDAQEEKNPIATPAWTIEKAAWNTTDGFPSCGCFFNDRMYLARGQTVWGSETGNFESFPKGSTDDSGIYKTISDNEINKIVSIAAVNDLTMFTRGGEYTASAPQDKNLSPTAFNVTSRGNRGSKLIEPIRVGGTILFVQAGGRKIREFTYDYGSDSYLSPDLLVLADHLTQDYPIVAMAYAQEPDSILYAARQDGVLLALVYQRKEQVTGWSRLTTDGEVVTIDTIPRPELGRDWLWAGIRRDGIEGFGAVATANTDANGTITSVTVSNSGGRGYGSAPTITVSGGTGANLVAVISNTSVASVNVVAGGTGYANGAELTFVGGNTMTRSYIEYLEDYSETALTTRQWPELYLDCSVIRQPEGNNVTNMGHLEGKRVTLVGDGQVIRRGTVTNGKVSRGSSNSAVYEVGLPYDAKIRTLEPIIPSEAGGNMMTRGWVWVTVVFKRALGLALNGQALRMRKTTDPIDEHTPLKDGKLTIRDANFDGRGRITIEANDPYPAEVGAIEGELQVGNQPENVLENTEDEDED